MALWQALTEAGLCELWYLDERGFAPTLPTGYTRARTGTRALVWDEPPRGRRLNVLGAVAPYGDAPRLAWIGPPGKIDSPVLLEFVWREVAGLPASPAGLPAGYRLERPCIIVLDNASAHTSKAVTAMRPTLEAAGVTFYYLPPYSPELNRIEDLWRHVKYEALPQRSYRTLDDLRTAVTTALTSHASRLVDDTINFRKAA